MSLFNWGNLLTNPCAVASVPAGDVIFFASMSFNLLGDALRDTLEPHATRGALP
jgi:ABC-type dipeptide/oligopeptide/nickel transport system permease subunit